MFRSALLYAALLIGANAAFGAGLEGLNTGEMRHLVIAATPKPAGTAAFTDRDGTTHYLADWRGRVVLVNFWSVSCVPCREEMPALNALEKKLGGADFAVVPIAFGYNNAGALSRFLRKYAVDALPVLLDPGRALAAQMGVVAPPVSVLLDRDGNEVARLIGGADWSGDDAIALIRAVIDNPHP